MKDKQRKNDPADFKTRLSEPHFRAAFFTVCAWSAFILVTVIITAVIKMDAAFIPFLIAAFGILAGNVLFGRELFIRNNKKPYLAFRKYSGYMAVVLYIAHAVPRLSWQSSGGIGEGTAFFMFILTLILTALGALVFLSLRSLKAQVYWEFIDEKEAADKKLRKKNASMRKMSIGAQIFDWIDAFLYAVVLIILINTFLFQIYAIPSESMVPTFLIKDRPFTIKFLSGPAFPFSEYRLPVLKNPARGDVVVLRNPRYDKGRDLLKQQLSKFVFMLTFSAVNPDRYDELGREKADPLVKRIIGLPGEKIMMRDDKVYVKTKDDAEFRYLEIDAAEYSNVDIYSLPAGTRSGVKTIPIDRQTRELLKKWDDRKNGTGIDAFRNSLSALFDGFENGVRNLTNEDIARFDSAVLKQLYPDPAGKRTQEIEAIRKDTANRFRDIRTYYHELLHFRDLLSDDAAFEDFKTYILGWTATREDDSPYARDTRVMNLFFKDNLLRLFLRDLELLNGNGTMESFRTDGERTRILGEAEELYTYVFRYFDPRNFPEFPAGDGYIPEGSYFPMGDNRYNSVDFRHSGVDVKRASLDKADPASIIYLTNIGPILLPERNVEGYAVWRIWPLSRFGAVD